MNVLANSIIMAARKRKIRDEVDLLAVTEEKLANDSDSDAEYVSLLSSK
jgi:adenine-specific DNA methylase